MWRILRRAGSRPATHRPARVSPDLELLEGRIVLSPIGHSPWQQFAGQTIVQPNDKPPPPPPPPPPQPPQQPQQPPGQDPGVPQPDPPAPGNGPTPMNPPPPRQNDSSSQENSSSVSASQELRPAPQLAAPPPAPQAPPPPPPAGGPAGNNGQPGRPGGPMGGPGGPGGTGAPPSPPRALLNGRDPNGLLNAFAHPLPIQDARGQAASRTALAMRLFLTDFDDLLPQVEISDTLSFLENDDRLNDEEFAALVTNTRPRADVVPQQGSSVASVATLMPSDRPEAVAETAVNELAPLLLSPVHLPVSPKPASASGSSANSDEAPPEGARGVWPERVPSGQRYVDGDEAGDADSP